MHLHTRSIKNLLIALTLLLPGCLLAQPARSELSAPPPARPNILWITVEDITTFVGAYGDRQAKTPNIDRLAKEGVRYSRAFTVAGVCAPSRAGFITGMYPTSIGAQHMRTLGSEMGKSDTPSKYGPKDLPFYSAVLPPQVKAFPEYLRKAGYYTSNNEKTDYQFIAPVTVWDENGPAASYRNRPAGKPFFSVFNFFLTHEVEIALNKAPLLVDPATLSVPPIYPDAPAVRGDLARLYTNIEMMDKQVGELIQQLKDDGVYDNTIIFFFSDNGGNLPWMKREVLERGTHIPFIVRFPHGRDGGKTEAELISGVDLAPTVLSLAGIPIPQYIQGQAFLGEQRAKSARRYVFAARDRMDSEYDRVRMVRDKQYRYIYNYMPELPNYQNLKFRLMLPSMQEILKLRDAGALPPAAARWFDSKPAEELYDAERDPWELHNLAGDPQYAKKLAELRAAFQQWTSQYGDMGGMPEREMVRQMWNGGAAPPRTAQPEFIRTEHGVRLHCATEGASIGYWIERRNSLSAATASAAATHTVQSWDYGVLLGPLFGKGIPNNGDSVPVPTVWTVYDGGEIALGEGDVLHVNAQRIGYEAALIDYADGAPLAATTAQ